MREDPGPRGDGPRAERGGEAALSFEYIFSKRTTVRYSSPRDKSDKVRAREAVYGDIYQTHRDCYWLIWSTDRSREPTRQRAPRAAGIKCERNRSVRRSSVKFDRGSRDIRVDLERKLGVIDSTRRKHEEPRDGQPVCKPDAVVRPRRAPDAWSGVR